MSLLDELRQQAEEIRLGDSAQHALKAEAVGQVEAAMARGFRYFQDLLQQLKVIRPSVVERFQLPRLALFPELVLEETFLDYRKSRAADREFYDGIFLQVRWAADAPLRFARVMPGEIQRLRDLLWSNGVRYEEEEMRRGDGTLTCVEFTIPAAIVTDLRLVAQPDRAAIRIAARNMERLGLEEFVVPAEQLTESVLEQFAAALLGRRSSLGTWRVAGTAPR